MSESEIDPIPVPPERLRCADCDGEMQVVDADDISLFVECVDCESEIRVEVDALGDGGIDYWPRITATKESDAFDRFGGRMEY